MIRWFPLIPDPSTDKPLIRLHLSVHRGVPSDRAGDGGVPYWRDMQTWFLPGAEDSVVLWSHEGEGPLWPVRRRYWKTSGRVCVELMPMQVDPDKGMEDFPRRRPWSTRTDGDPEPKLLAGGWQVHGEDHGHAHTGRIAGTEVRDA